MDVILFASILIRVIAIVWSVYLIRKLRDWRMGFLTLMFTLMALRQIFTVSHSFEGWYLSLPTHTDEIPGLIVSILSLVIVIAFERIIEDQKIKSQSLHDKSTMLDLYKDYFEAATSGLFVFDNEVKLINVNNETCRMHGYTREEMLALQPTEFVHPDSHHLFKKYIETARKGEVFHEIAKDVCKDGRIIDVEVEGIMASVDNQNYFIASLIDITEKIKAQKALQESEDKYRSIVEATCEWIWEIDVHGCHTYSNN